MADFVNRTWAPLDASGLSRKDRTPGRYRAYVPDELGSSLPNLAPEATAAAANAQATLARADERIGTAGTYLNHLLIRSESISSSWIEGNRVTPKKLAIAELLQQGSRAAIDVIANVRATESAIATLADRTHPVTTHDIEKLQHTIEPRLGFGLRQEQNWVGGSGWSPLRADFIPPPESEVPRLVRNLASFVSATEGSPIVRAAIAHAQFETIHPFTDGNGRTGRALIHTVLRRTDTLRNVLIPISTVFASNTDSYIAGLNAFRAEPQDLNTWVIGFARAAEKSAANAVLLASDIVRLASKLEEKLIAFRRGQGLSPARPRRNAVVWRILADLPAHPVQTIASAAETSECSTAAAHRALTQLAEAGVLKRNKDHKGHLLCWTADQYLALVSLTERSDRVGGGDTQGDKPVAGPPVPEVGVVGRLRPHVDS